MPVCVTASGVVACRGATHVVSVFELSLSGGRFEWSLVSDRFESAVCEWSL